MKQALLMRYSLIPYWYTLHYEATTKSTTVVRPLLFEYWFSYISIHIEINYFVWFRYTDDPNTYNIDQQFLVGPAILVSPNLVSVNSQL